MTRVRVRFIQELAILSCFTIFLAATDLWAADSTLTSVALTWVAPGDDGDQGTASEYDLRYSTVPITEANWPTASQVIGEPIPQPAGGTEIFMVTGLLSNTLYYFALKTADEVPNWSPVSDTVSTVTGDRVPPAPVTDLAVLVSP